jgi:23S rRNA (adenine2503-C2)-methyltransferase
MEEKMTKKELKIIDVPTGKIGILEEKANHCEFLSIGDYGKENNLKADFLGLTKEINNVEHKKIMPLENKWVITISTQYGCSMNCSFCDVPKVGRGKNIPLNILKKEFEIAKSFYPNVKPKRINLHFARMGEPTFNFDTIKLAKELKLELKKENILFHPVISTMMPKNNIKLYNFLSEWIKFKNEDGDAGLQLSINTTDEETRNKLTPNSLSLPEISEIMYRILLNEKNFLKGRKITLNFAITKDYKIDVERLLLYFNPNLFLVKITPIHETYTSKKNNIYTPNGYNSYNFYREIEEKLKKFGFDVIVFIPSEVEDKSRITCGNAILSLNKEEEREYFEYINSIEKLI